MAISIPLSDGLPDLVESKVAAGNYASSTDVINAALKLPERRDKERFARLADLRAAVQEGIDSGGGRLWISKRSWNRCTRNSILSPSCLFPSHPAISKTAHARYSFSGRFGRSSEFS